MAKVPGLRKAREYDVHNKHLKGRAAFNVFRIDNG